MQLSRSSLALHAAFVEVVAQKLVLSTLVMPSILTVRSHLSVDEQRDAEEQENETWLHFVLQLHRSCGRVIDGHELQH